MKYNRILLKLSGESLMGSQSYGIDPQQLEFFVNEIEQLIKSGIETGIVIGGGNIFRGVQGAAKGFDRIDGDYLGMLATVMNSLALKSEFEKRNIKSIVFSGLDIPTLCSRMHSANAIHFLEAGYVVIIAGGTGNPFFTTDTASVLRALEIKADILLKGTRVDGVYDKDPEKYPEAIKFQKLTFQEAYSKNLMIMDLTAFTLCRDNNLPVIVFNMNKKGNLLNVIQNPENGTLIEN